MQCMVGLSGEIQGTCQVKLIKFISFYVEGKKRIKEPSGVYVVFAFYFMWRWVISGAASVGNT